MRPGARSSGHFTLYHLLQRRAIPQKSLTDPRPGRNDFVLHTEMPLAARPRTGSFSPGQTRRRSIPLTMKSAQIDRVTVALDSFRIEAPTRVKRKIEATLQTVTMAQELYAKASLADRCEL